MDFRELGFGELGFGEMGHNRCDSKFMLCFTRYGS